MLSLKFNSRRGFVLAAALTILVILTVVTVAVARTARGSLALAKRSLGTMNVQQLAWAGLTYAIEDIRTDSRHPDSSAYDTAEFCGVAPERQRREPIELKNGFFEVHPFSDEEGKINLNGLNADNVDMLKHLLKMLDVDEDQAHRISHAIVDWKDSDFDPSDPQTGAEAQYYESLHPPYRPKNTFFQSLEELTMVREIDGELLEKMRPFVTVFPQDDLLRINLDTASETVLKAVGRAFAGGRTNAGLEDADALARKIIREREDADGPVDFENMKLNAKERAVAERWSALRTKVSDYLSVSIHAKESRYGVKADVEAVIERNDLRIVQWREKEK